MKPEKRIRSARSVHADNLILTQPEEEQAADDLLASLSTLAFSSPTAPELVVTDESSTTYKSRFFFKPSVSFNQEVENRKQDFKPTALDHVDSVVEGRLSTYKKEMPVALSANIETVREFFLTQIAPLTLASVAGTSQAQDVVQRLVGSAVDGTVFDKYDKMLRSAINISMARFITQYLGLPKSAHTTLLNELVPKQHQGITIPIPTAAADEITKPDVKPHRMQRIREARSTQSIRELREARKANENITDQEL